MKVFPIQAGSHRGVLLPLLAAGLIFCMEMPAVAAEADSYTGVVVKADTANGSLVVKNPETGGRFRFVIGADTPILSGTNSIALADIRPGDAVSVNYEKVEGRYEARKVMVQPPNGG